jgi:hypothetical protein
MSTAFQAAPPSQEQPPPQASQQPQEMQQRPKAASLAAEQAESTQSASGGAPPAEANPARGLEAQLANDDRTRARLHGLVLVLPLAVLIFGQALRFPKQEIELPIISLKLKVEEVLPVFLLILSFMLHRAMRYARIVLWSILDTPGQLREAARISLDDTEAYKMNSAYYEDVLDPMTALLIRWRWKLAGLFARTSLITFNVIVAFTVYGLILLMLAVMAYYVSASVIDLSNQWHVAQYRPRWPIDAQEAVDILVLGISAILLGLAWLNAAWIIITPAAAIFVGIARVILAFFGLMRRALRSGSPGKFVLGAIVSNANRLREHHRDRVLARDLERFHELRDAAYYERHAEEHRTRRGLYDYANGLLRKLFNLEFQYGLFIFDHGKDGEWDKVEKTFGFRDLLRCLTYLEIAAHRAPLDFVIWQAPRLARQLVAIMNGYTVPLDEALDALVKRGSSLTPEEQESASVMIRARNAQIPGQGDQIRALREGWERKLCKAGFGKARFESVLEVDDCIVAATEHFKQPEETELIELLPQRGARDWKWVTRVLAWLDAISTERLPSPSP